MRLAILSDLHLTVADMVIPDWIAVSVYVLVAIVKKRLNLDASLYTLRQILSVSIFEKIQLQQAFAGSGNISNQDIFSNQLNWFSI